jgi:hypothetical protein
MRSKISTIVLGVFLVFVCLMNAKDTKPEEEKKVEIKKHLLDLSRTYSDGFYKSVYSIEELKPYFILQIDRINTVYSNSWMSPDKIVELLSERDKAYLVKKLVDYISNINDSTKENAMIQKIQSWCLGQYQFDFITDKLCFSNEIIVNTAYSIPASKAIVAQYYGQQGPKTVKLSEEQITKAYYETLNFVSGLKPEEQLKYYSEIYNKLSTVSRKD